MAFSDKGAFHGQRSFLSYGSKDSNQQTNRNDELDMAMLADELTTGSSSRQARLDKRSAGLQNYNKGPALQHASGGLSCEPQYLITKERP